MWHCVISAGVITCQLVSNCFKYYNLWYAVRFTWCYWEKILKFNLFYFLPVSPVSVSDKYSSPYGDSRWGHIGSDCARWAPVTATYKVPSRPHEFICATNSHACQPSGGPGDSRSSSEFPQEPLALTHWGRDKMTAVSQTTFSKALSWMKMYKFWIKFHWRLFLKVQLTIFQHWFR